MNVLKVVLKQGEKLPENCFRCQFVEHYEMYKSACRINYMGAYSASRPEHCPLVVEEVCEWVKIKRNYPDSNEPYLVYQTGCEYEFDDWEVMVDWVFCPNCGKRIKYVESEE